MMPNPAARLEWKSFFVLARALAKKSTSSNHFVRFGNGRRIKLPKYLFINITSVCNLIR